MSYHELHGMAVLREKVTDLARTLGIELPDKGAGGADADAAAAGGPAGAAAIRLAIAKSWISARRQRNKLIGDSLFSDPAWDMMLDLYEKHHAERVVTVTSACLASGAPVSTAFRQLSRLEVAGWIDRKDDTVDGRKIRVALTGRALATMDQLMDNVLTAQQKLLTMCGAARFRS